MSKKYEDKELERAYRDLKSFQTNSHEDKNELLMFFFGLLMFGGGLFMIFQNTIVTSSWGHGYFYHIGSWGIPNGLIMLPVFIGIIMLFVMDRKIFGWIVTVLGIVFILLSIILSVHIVWRNTNLYMFILMFGLVAAGGGMMLRVLFKKN